MNNTLYLANIIFDNTLLEIIFWIIAVGLACVMGYISFSSSVCAKCRREPH